MPRQAAVKFVEDEDIYIDCRPVSTYGGELIINDEDDSIENTGVSSDMIDDIAINVTTGAITDNVGFQTLLGIGLLGILYAIGNYVFKEFPKKIIAKKMYEGS
tara:strand:+ start:544 stop:852 length:309 start_codon:yes stop_codon:yes gene_type:complete